MYEDTTLPSLKTLFRFPFKTPGWQSRFVVGTAMIYASFVIPILPVIFINGYLLRIMRKAIRGEELTLPAWDEWGKMGKDGLRGLLVNLGYMFPGFLLTFGGMAAYFAMIFVVPLISALVDSSNEGLFLLPLGLLGAMGMLFLSMFVGTLFLVLGALPLPMATAYFVDNDQVSAAFRVKQWWPLLRANKSGYFIAWVLAMGLFTVLYFTAIFTYYTIILCWLMPVLIAPFGFYLAATSMAVFGQTYRESTALAALEQVNSKG